MSHNTLVALFFILLLPGFLGVFLPLLPGIPFMFVVSLVFAFLDKFQHLTGKELVILGSIALVSLAIDQLSGVVGAKIGGASPHAIKAGLLGLILGTLILPVFGGIIGLFVGVLLDEFLLHRNQAKALKAAGGSLLGTVGGIFLNALLGILFLILFVRFSL